MENKNFVSHLARNNHHTKSILIVEDDKFIREMMVREIKRAGYQILEAMTGESGLEIAKTQHVDLILLDLILPGISGFDVMGELRKSDLTKSIPVIVLSNYVEQESTKRSKELGAHAYLVKAQLNPSEIIEYINRFFNDPSKSVKMRTGVVY